jgi:hypothetical protein
MNIQLIKGSLALSLLGILTPGTPVTASPISSQLSVSSSGIQTRICHQEKSKQSCRTTLMNILTQQKNVAKPRSQDKSVIQGLSIEIPGNFIFHVEGL